MQMDLVRYPEYVIEQIIALFFKSKLTLVIFWYITQLDGTWAFNRNFFMFVLMMKQLQVTCFFQIVVGQK